jgi:hypothetical protein
LAYLAAKILVFNTTIFRGDYRMTRNNPDIQPSSGHRITDPDNTRITAGPDLSDNMPNSCSEAVTKTPTGV